MAFWWLLNTTWQPNKTPEERLRVTRMTHRGIWRRTLSLQHVRKTISRHCGWIAADIFHSPFIHGRLWIEIKVQTTMKRWHHWNDSLLGHYWSSSANVQPQHSVRLLHLAQPRWDCQGDCHFSERQKGTKRQRDVRGGQQSERKQLLKSVGFDKRPTVSKVKGSLK